MLSNRPAAFFTRLLNDFMRRRPRVRRLRRVANTTEQLEVRQLLTTYYVATNGSDTNAGTSLNAPYKTIQHALDEASHPNDTILVRGGTYNEHLNFPHSGSASGGEITLEPYSNEKPVLNGTGVASTDIGYGDNMVQMINISYVKFAGFEIENDNGSSTQSDATGILVQGSGTNVIIENNVIHDITGSVSLGIGGSGIQVYGTSTTTPYTNVLIVGNQIYNCQPGDSETETLTVNGNVTNFQINSNVIHDDNNIGIDMIGGEGDIFGLANGTQNLPVARNGICSHNTVYHIHANYGGGFAAGIYVDGGKGITVWDNTSYGNDTGLEVGAENHGYIASSVIVENNVLYNNNQGGLIFGGYASNVGRVQNCTFINNTVVNSDLSNTGQGALTINYASNNIIANNIFVASTNNVVVNCANSGSSTGNVLNNNLYYAPGGQTKGIFTWNGSGNLTYSQFKTATNQDAQSQFANPLFVNSAQGNFKEAANSPSIRKGSSKTGYYSTADFSGVTRTLPPDIGAYQYAS